MRERIARAADDARIANPWEAKLGPGRMQDIELVAQGAALVAGSPERAPEAQLAAGAEAGFLAPDAARALGRAHALLAALNQAGRLLLDRPLDVEAVGEGGRAFLLRATGAEDIEALGRQLTEEAEDARQVISDFLATETTA